MLPTTADVVVIGGGVIGTSIAFHLARLGLSDVILLERTQLAAGATGLSSGLVRMHYDNPLEAEIAFKSFATFRHFDDVIGGDCGFTRTGFLYVVQPHNEAAMRANVAMMQGLGVETALVSSAQVRELAPYLAIDDVQVAAHEPESGYADPHLTTQGFADAARRLGIKIFQGVEATGIEVERGRVKAVQTSQDRVATPVAVNAAGPWGALVAAMAGVTLDLAVMHHQVAFLETPRDVPWPHLTVIDDVHQNYWRPESGHLTLVGGDHDNQAISTDKLDSYSQSLTPETRYRILERVCTRIPAMETAGVRRGHAGIYVNTRDQHALMGPAPGVEGFYCAVGFSGHGFKEAPVAGQAMAELILNGQADVVDITPLRPTRFEEGQPYEGPHPYVEFATRS
jgi:sarcosine oxidase subunit beta